MKIEMTETVQGSLDGETVQKLVKGHEYDTVNTPRGERLAQYHIDQGVAVLVKAKAESKPESPAPEVAPAIKPTTKAPK